MNEVAPRRDPSAQLPERVLAVAVPRPQPDWFDPMLATLTEDRFSDPAWLYERKLDGERCLAFKRGGSVTLRSRNRESLAHYPEIAEALARQAADGFVLDGEIVGDRGRRSSFELLQRRMGIRDPVKAVATGVRVRYVVFDVLYGAGHDLTPVPLRDRKPSCARCSRSAASSGSAPTGSATASATPRRRAGEGGRASSPNGPTRSTWAAARPTG